MRPLRRLTFLPALGLAVLLIGAFTLDLRLRFGGMSPIIAEVPVRSSPPLPNAIPAELIEPKVRCDWYVVCGRYVNLQDTDLFDPLDSVELTESGVAYMDVRRSHPVRRGGVSGCYDPIGRWSAERLSLSEHDSRTIHRIIISTCPNIMDTLRCTVEISRLENPIREDRLVCDSGVTWILCEIPREESGTCEDPR